MLKVTIAAPFDVKGRYLGGIASIVNSIINEKEIWQANSIKPIIFETCRIQRDKSSSAKFNLKNIKNFLAIRKDIISELTLTDSQCLYYHTSVGIALLKDLLVVKKVKKRLNIPVILHIHFAEYEKIMSKKWLSFFIMRLLKKYVDHIVFLSKNTKDEFVEKGISENKCSVIYNFSTFNFTGEEIENSSQKATIEKKMLFVGSIDNRKGIFDILDCMKKIDGNYSLHVCGGFASSVEEEKFNNYVKNFDGKVVFHSYVNGKEKEDVFKDSDVLLLPSYGEGLPVVILEALSAGCSIIASNVGAIPEIISKENGIIVDAGNEKQLHVALSYYINLSREEIRKQQLANYEYSKNFTIDNFIKETCDVCYKTIDSVK